MDTAAGLRAAGARMTRGDVETIAAKFRTEIGTVYEVVAAQIELDHAHVFEAELGATQHTG